MTKKIRFIDVTGAFQEPQLQFGNRNFGYSAPAAWNSLPENLHDSSISLLSFKSMLKTHALASFL